MKKYLAEHFDAVLLSILGAFGLAGALIKHSAWGFILGILCGIGAFIALVFVLGLVGNAIGVAKGELGPAELLSHANFPFIQATFAVALVALLIIGPRYLSGRMLLAGLGVFVGVGVVYDFVARRRGRF
jgi:hypothetical protein